MSKPAFPLEVIEFFRKTGARGGISRAEKHSREQLSAWGKLGGRPRVKQKQRQKKLEQANVKQ